MLSKLKILTHSVQFFDTLLIYHSKMIKKILNILLQPKENAHIDAKIWVQKILLEEKFRKINN